MTETYQPSHAAEIAESIRQAVTPTPADRRARLARWLRTSSAYDLVDDAVMGCLEENTVLELFEDFGIPCTPDSRRWFAREIDAILAAGY